MAALDAGLNQKIGYVGQAGLEEVQVNHAFVAAQKEDIVVLLAFEGDVLEFVGGYRRWIQTAIVIVELSAISN